MELFRVDMGDSSTTRRAIRRLREFAALDAPPLVPRDLWGPIDMRICPLLLETMLEGGRDHGTASRLDSLDAIMQDGPRWLTLGPGSVPVVAANWTIARLREAQGDLPRALAAIRRRENNYYPALPLDAARLPASGGPARGARR